MPNPYGRPKGSKNRIPAVVKLPFRQSEIMRGIRACAAMGLSVEAITIKDGKVTIVPAQPQPAKPAKVA
jgi:hypothetical protein